MTTKQPDAYRAGLLSVREIAASCGVYYTAIQMCAKSNGWGGNSMQRSSMITECEVTSKGPSEPLATERGLVEVSTEAIVHFRNVRDGAMAEWHKRLDDLNRMAETASTRSSKAATTANQAVGMPD